MKNVIRHSYLETLSRFCDKNLIKVITGVRRVGKSTLMQQFQDLLMEKNPEISLLSINLDIPEYRFLAEKSWKDLYDFITKALHPNKMNYIFLDEIQNVTEFEKLLEGLFVQPNIDLYVTGSNAYLLSSELATLLTGRTYEINLLPFSFAEYLKLSGKQENLNKAFVDYMRIGGFPEAIKLSVTNPVYTYQYLQSVYNNIYRNDILKRFKIYSESSYQAVVNYLINTIGSSVSSGNIAKTLTANGAKTDNKSVSRYIEMLVDAFLFYKVNRYDIKGKQLLATQEKYYSVDTGFRNALLGKELTSNSGHLLENIIYLELLRRRNQVWIGKADLAEVDFVVRNEEGYLQYIQVSQTVQNPDTLARELAPFDRINDHNEKILITMDYETGSRNGVKQVNAIDWLLKDSQ
ncbi:MAG: ATP-binding protein [Lentimicrobiaceae bacterium]|nr:ATP-binding protein [Lentimicrobiaceae bacterium]